MTVLAILIIALMVMSSFIHRVKGTSGEAQKFLDGMSALGYSYHEARQFWQEIHSGKMPYQMSLPADVREWMRAQ